MRSALPTAGDALAAIAEHKRRERAYCVAIESCKGYGSLRPRVDIDDAALYSIEQIDLHFAKKLTTDHLDQILADFGDVVARIKERRDAIASLTQEARDAIVAEREEALAKFKASFPTREQRATLRKENKTVDRAARHSAAQGRELLSLRPDDAAACGAILIYALQEGLNELTPTERAYAGFLRHCQRVFVA